jgi:hypothetical protein
MAAMDMKFRKTANIMQTFSLKFSGLRRGNISHSCMLMLICSLSLSRRSGGRKSKGKNVPSAYCNIYANCEAFEQRAFYGGASKIMPILKQAKKVISAKSLYNSNPRDR